jgi:phosphoserine phosphatase RsbU/P
MRKYIGTLSQSDFVRRLNREFVSFARQGQFATALLATYFAPTDHLLLCNAGHPRPLLYRAATQEWRLIDSETPETVDRVANIPLGIISPTDYDQFGVALKPDDLIILYTDSLPEWADAQDRRLTEEGLLRIVEGLDAGRPEALVRALLDAIARERGTQRAADDTTLVVLRHNATDPGRMSVGQILRLIARMLYLIKV